MRIKGVALKNHCYISVLRRNVVDLFVINKKLARGDILKPRYHAQGC